MTKQNSELELKQQLLGVHIAYELRMLRWAADTLNGRLPALPTDLFVYACIEVACFHARVLLDFFTKDGSNPTDGDVLSGYAKAVHFADEHYTPMPRPKALVGRLNNQAAHLSYARVSAGAPISVGEVTELRDVIDREVTRFRGYLREEFRDAIHALISD